MKGTAMADKTVEVKDNDYSLTRVPAEGKQPMWKILMVRSGALCCVSQLALGASLGFGMTFWGAFEDDYLVGVCAFRGLTHISLLFVDGNPAGVKALLHEMGFIENVLRLPLVPTRITTLQKMTEILKTLKI